jgi:hypothetical protein
MVIKGVKDLKKKENISENELKIIRIWNLTIKYSETSRKHILEWFYGKLKTIVLFFRREIIICEKRIVVKLASLKG